MCDRVVSEDPFLIVYCPNKYITPKICDEAVDDSLAALKLITDWFVRTKMIKNFLLLCMQMKIYSILMKILVMLYLIIMKWVFLVLILIILILIKILMKMILILLFLSEFWLGILNLKNAKSLKKNISEEFLKNIREELIAIAKFGSYWDCGIGDIMFYTLSRDLPRRRNYIVLSHFG